MSLTLSRRTCLGLLALAATTWSPSARSLGRVPVGGTLHLALPWFVSRLDPHAIDDPLAALVGTAVADSLYAVDAQGRPYPALASALPEDEGGETTLEIRPGLRTALGKPLDARDAVYSLNRARRAGAASLLAGVAHLRVDGQNRRKLRFAKSSPADAARLLSSPLLAIVPRGYSPLKPDGTGAFRARLSADRCVLERNPYAARGASFLERIIVQGVPSLGQALRSFEASDSDVGWLGAGLYRRRPGAVPFVAPAYGAVALRTGHLGGRWTAPGVARQLAASLDPTRLTHLGLRAARRTSSGDRWMGESALLYVDESSPQLVEVARVVAELLSQPGHALTARPIPRARTEQLIRRGDFPLMLSFVRHSGLEQGIDGHALLAALGSSLAESAPPALRRDVAAVESSHRIAVLGELELRGFHLPTVHRLTTWDLGGVWREPPTS